ncbi:MAG: tetratricopeptide repeat protein [Verrucomicrobiota bacterium]
MSFLFLVSARRRRGCSFALALLSVLVLVAGCSKESRKARHLADADRYYDQHRFAEARLEYINVLQMDPNEPRALERFGAICYEQGQTHQAFALLHKAKELRPTNAVTRLNLARLDLSMGQVDAAREEIIAVLKTAPDNADAILLLTDALANAAHVTDTEQRLREFAAKNGNKAAVHVALGKLALIRGDQATCASELQQALALETNSIPALLASGSLDWARGALTNAADHFKRAADLAPQDWATRLKYAEFKIRTGDFENAKQIAGAIIQQSSNNIPALLCLARLSLAQARHDDAISFTDRILADRAPDPEAMQLHAQATLAKGDAAQATKEFERLRDEFPRAPQFQYNLSLAYLRGRRIPEAVATLKQALTLQPAFTEAILLLAEISIQQRELPAAVKSLTELLEKQPKLERAYPLLIEAYRSQGAMDQAMAVCDKWTQLFPSTPQAPYFAGVLLRQQQKPAEAVKAFESCLKLAPSYEAAVEQLVDLDVAEKRIQSAADRAAELTKLRPNSARAWLLLGRMHLSQTNSVEAEKDLEKAIELEPGSSAAGILLAQLYVRSNRQQEAIDRLEALIAKTQNNWPAFSLLALIQQEMKQYAKARESYEKVVQFNPKAAAAYNNLAYVCGEHLHDNPAAYTYAQKARDLAPEDPSIADTYGWILCQRKDYAWALTALRQSADKLPSNPEVQYHLGTVYYMMGDEAQALGPLRLALKAENDFPGKSRAQSRLWALELDPATAAPADLEKLNGLIKDDPDDVISLLRKAAIATRDATLDQALEAYRSAVRANPKSTTLLLKLARFLADRMHDPAGAYDQGKLAAELAPADPVVAQTVGRLAYQAKDYKHAYSLLQTSVKEQATPDLWFDLAQAAYYAGRVPEALQAVRQAVAAPNGAAKGDTARRFLDMLTLAEEPPRAADALPRLETALQNQPDDLPALMAAAAAYEFKNQPQQAKEIYEQKVLKIVPDYGPALRKLAYLYGKQLADDDKASDAATKAREFFPDDPGLAEILGKIAYRRENYTVAVQMLRDTLGQRPNDAEAYYYLGMAQYKLKQPQQSKENLQKALALNLDPQLAVEANRILAEK